ncbi:hypothetical protein AB0M28_28835 [Streptomyces sp. NPDC051940]|uniref:DUF7158 domain-containing protein n=1 Tax=Streptomyces sp. NPDC051940 TaxID=3155675 RepID=UPI003435A7B6
MSDVLGFLDGRPLPRSELDRRLAELHGGPRSAALPKPGTAEDRQLTRWVAQVLLTEELCAAEAAARGLTPVGPLRLDRRAAVELGSIAAAAYERSPWVRAVYAAVTAGVRAEEPGVRAEEPGVRPAPDGVRWRIASPDGDYEAAPETLPAELAAALRTAGPGRRVTAGTWTATLVAVVPHGPGRPAPDDGLGAARRLAFVRWLGRARAERLTLVPGLEHPGDPAQPDNHHQH